MVGDFYYTNRAHAGKVLAEAILEAGIEKPILLALPRGGVPVAEEISKTLGIPFDVLIVRKIGSPFNPEYGIGAMTEDFEPLMNAEAFLPVHKVSHEIEDIIDHEKEELKRRILLYRGQRDLPVVRNKNVVLIDDGLATGVSASAAAHFLKLQGAARISLAVPVGPRQVGSMIKKYVDEIICPYKPSRFSGVGQWYRDFNQVTDQEVIATLARIHGSGATKQIQLDL